MSPRFPHDCRSCTFLGTVQDAASKTFDLWVCAGERTVILRYGASPPDYGSGSGVVWLDTPAGRLRFTLDRP